MVCQPQGKLQVETGQVKSVNHAKHLISIFHEVTPNTCGGHTINLFEYVLVVPLLICNLLKVQLSDYKNLQSRSEHHHTIKFQTQKNLCSVMMPIPPPFNNYKDSEDPYEDTLIPSYQYHLKHIQLVMITSCG